MSITPIFCCFLLLAIILQGVHPKRKFPPMLPRQKPQQEFIDRVNEEIALFGIIADEFYLLDDAIDYYFLVQGAFFEPINTVLFYIFDNARQGLAELFDNELQKIFLYIQQIAVYISEVLEANESDLRHANLRILYPFFLGIVFMIDALPLYNHLLLPEHNTKN